MIGFPSSPITSEVNSPTFPPVSRKTGGSKLVHVGFVQATNFRSRVATASVRRE